MSHSLSSGLKWLPGVADMVTTRPADDSTTQRRSMSYDEFAASSVPDVHCGIVTQHPFTTGRDVVIPLNLCQPGPGRIMKTTAVPHTRDILAWQLKCNWQTQPRETIFPVVSWPIMHLFVVSPETTFPVVSCTCSSCLTTGC